MGNSYRDSNMDELLSSYIDNEIKEAFTKKRVHELIDNDPLINKKYNAELLTKNLLRSRISRVEVPKASSDKVISEIDNLIKQVTARHEAALKQNTVQQKKTSPSFLSTVREFLTTSLTAKLPVPRYAFAMVLVLFTVIVTFFALRSSDTQSKLNPFIVNGTEKSVMVQAVSNFEKIMNGDITPKLVSNDTYKIRNYVMENTNFDPYIPDIDGFELVGSVCNEYAGEKLAHLVYQSGDKFIYIYEVPVNALQKSSLDMPEQVNNTINKDKFYMCDNVSEDGCTLMMWYYDNKICATVSNMPKSMLMSKFASIR